MLLLEQFFTEYMPLSSGLSQNTVRSYKHSFRLLFQYVYQTKKKEAGEIRFRDLDFETVDGFLKWIETERGCSVSTRNLRRHFPLLPLMHRTEILKLRRCLPTQSGEFL